MADGAVERSEGEPARATTAAAPEKAGTEDEFYLRYYSGHKGRFGHEFMEFEFRPDGLLRYANSSHYKRDAMIRKQARVHESVIAEVKRIVEESKVIELDDREWPEPNEDGRQELEVVLGDEHISFTCATIGSFAEIAKTKDPEGLQAFHFLVQDLRSLVFSLISMHFKIRPIP